MWISIFGCDWLASRAQSFSIWVRRALFSVSLAPKGESIITMAFFMSGEKM